MDVFGVAVENVVVGVGAALLVGLAVRAKDLARDKYLERQYPIAGEYVTTWEQEVDGESITESAVATLSQRGRDVVGRSEMPGSDIEWKFEGEVSETGYLNGIYYSTNPHSTSIGNFFFHIHHDGELEGLWSGYQERNDRLNSGRYRFVPVLDAYEVRPVDRGHVPAVVDIAEQQLGSKDRSGEWFGSVLDDDGPGFAHVARMDTEFQSGTSLAGNLTSTFLGETSEIRESGPGDPVASEALGFCVGRVLEQAEFEEYIRLPESELSGALRQAESVGVVDAVAVKEGFEKRGIGTTLLGECIDECVDRGATALFAVGWETDEGVNVRGLMNYFGFRELTRVEGCWADPDATGDDPPCETCGESPCTCTAVVYTRYQPRATRQKRPVPAA
jgi:GNAT superfamily N-acetyltransferase